jgi:4-amino-4-deoxy-L-arabinose transferase-like glycosyltransferase
MAHERSVRIAGKMGDTANRLLQGEPHGRTAKLLLIVALVLGALIRVAWFVHSRHHAFIWDEPIYDGIAARMLHNGATMTGVDGKATAFVGPAYPVFVFIIYSTFGHQPQWVSIVQILLSTLTTYLVYCIAVMLTNSRLLAGLSALAVAVYAPLIQYVTLVHTETVFALLIALTLFFALLAVERQRTAYFLLAGISAGLAGLCRGSALPLPFLLAAIMLTMSKRTKPVVLRTLLFLAICLLALSPWVIRNYYTFHAIVPGATEAGYALWTGTCGRNSDSDKSDISTLPRYVEQYMATKPSEVEASAFFQREAIKAIEADPGRFAGLSAVKFARFWLNVGYGKRPSKASLAILFLHSILLALTIYSVKLVNNRIGVAMVGLTLVSFTILHMLTIGLVRYSLPFVPYTIILGIRGGFRLVPSLERLLSEESVPVPHI